MYPFRNNVCNLTWAVVKYHRFSTSALYSSQAKVNYYSHLQVGSEATQNEIKASYYRLSKLYHPDKNKGSEAAAKKFREITAAYEVLGNIRTRKLYDRGLANTEIIYETPTGAATHDDSKENGSAFNKTRQAKKPSKVYKGHTEQYNFDEWTRAHYSASFSKINESRQQREVKERMETFSKEEQRSFSLMDPLMFVIVSIVMIQIFFTSDYDDATLVDRRKLAQAEAAKKEAQKTPLENPDVP
ncbi:dnaJ homolog subfamily C member 30 isoform X2 [Diaphorina citri]|uniref:DnaJ homolog subfamily C member 30 isoform X1 n=1 Tax=Diaphorina citri TaxID=121845 RepID=A0A1S3CYK0_DIACI|nr:dnaJ homolog subfamily C member 30 isoform X1 [Diaphorina citri]XP_026678329.1 dnaJ homolog subfamily C member 30 isoform X1 [Diaphorina citri]XP_026678330.1 dnaJ homolog subfamily C member 30 isoform X2 [Diaphorina citri]